MESFDTRKVTEELIIWLRNWFLENGQDCNAVVGISGGKDSTVVAALLVKALGKDRVIGVMMPNGEQKDISDSIKVCQILGIKNVTINIKDIVDSALLKILKGVREFGKTELSSQTIINLPARIRMLTLYGVSQTMNGRVINTCNLSEDWVGYSTRYGDAAGDVSPLANLTVDEVRKIGLELGLPYELVYKTPSDGLCGKSDEDNLGFTYEVLDKYLRTGICEDEETKNLIDKKHVLNKFKLELMPSYRYGKVKANRD